jgi:beta-glucanase (GH16 family)
MKRYLLIAACFFLVCCSTIRKDGPWPETADSSKKWKLVFQDEFNGNGSFDTTRWSFCKRGNPAWARYLTQSADYAFLDGSNLVLRMDNKQIPGDDVPYHSGGIQTKGKFSFLYGKVEVRAKFTGGRGSWPAIWMMPEKDTYGGWPRSGEIDIMEHVNREEVIHQTIHNAAVTNASGGSTAAERSRYNAGDYNVYGVVWMRDKIEFYVNNTLRYVYHKPVNTTTQAWPFDQPFYLILNQSGGAGWPGPITDDDLPFSMQVDWVKVYQE